MTSKRLVDSHAKETGAPSSSSWHQLDANQALAACTSAAGGLSSAEAARRLKGDGPNTLVEKPSLSAWRVLGAQFKSILIWILVASSAVSWFMGESMDALAIFAIIVLNAGIGFWQELKTGKSVASLKKLTAPQARIRRQEGGVLIPAREIVVGDLLELEAGDVVPADSRILSAEGLRCVEAILTGESEAVSKQTAALPKLNTPLGERTNLVFSGTSVASGRGTAVVVATGMRTELGHIAGMLASAAEEEATPLQQRLEALGRLLLWATLGIVALLFALGLLRGQPISELLLTSISLAIAAVPEGLPAVVTVSLSLGVLRMARRHALLKKLSAVETLGCTSVICTDKTGTLTLGDMTARALYVAGRDYQITGEGYRPTGEILRRAAPVTGADVAPLRQLALVLIACNHARVVSKEGEWKVHGDPTEGALLVAANKAGFTTKDLEKTSPLLAEFPFDSNRKLSSVVRRTAEGFLRVFANGAPGPLLARCTLLYHAEGIRPLTPEDRARVLAKTAELATHALRVLASAYRDLGPGEAAPATAASAERDLVFVGLTGMYDPPRPEAKLALAACHAAGIRVVMITGDHPETARAIAQEIGLSPQGTTAVTGLALDDLTDEELKRRVPTIAVYARVSAEHKLRIIRALKSNGAMVAMTGDGINDAPAIQGADIGIAMGRTGADVTKQAADMVLTDDNFSTILAAVEEGRGVYANIRKTLQYLLAGSAGELLFMGACVVAGMSTPLLPIHLLWINLVTDGLPALCLAADPIDRDVMKRPPRSRAERITNRDFLGTMVLTGFLTAGVAFAVYVQALETGTVAEARTSAFAVMVFGELLRAFGARSAHKALWQITPRVHWPLLLVVLFSVVLHLWSHQSAALGLFLKTTPLPLADGLRLLALGAIPLLTLECVKLLRSSGKSKPSKSSSLS